MISARDSRFIEEAGKYIEDHLSERDLNVAELAAQLGKSRATAHRILRRALGQSASEFIRTYRLARAADLIWQGEMNIRQAAMITGFYNQSYFSKCFRAQFGVRPSEFVGRGTQGKVAGEKTTTQKLIIKN